MSRKTTAMESKVRLFFCDKSGIASPRFLDGLNVLSSSLASQNPDFSSKILPHTRKWEDIKILFSPSEAKLSPKEIALYAKSAESMGAESSAESSLYSASLMQNMPKILLKSITKDALWGGGKARNANINAYLEILRKSNHSELAKIFGTKRVDLDVLSACLEMLHSPRIEALHLYRGVAYKALSFESLEAGAQDFLRKSTLIFSNLFGAVRGGDALPYYHLNQNYRSEKLSLQSLYKAQRGEICALLDSAEIIIDLRAGVYVKAYPLKARPHYILPIPKGTSHQAKLHRGVALRNLATASLQGKNAIKAILQERFILTH